MDTWVMESCTDMQLFFFNPIELAQIDQLPTLKKKVNFHHNTS